MKIKNLYFSPVKSLSFNNVDNLEIIKNIILGFPEHHVILIVNAALSDLKKEFKGLAMT
mgnify:CR=1 FL=1